MSRNRSHPPASAPRGSRFGLALIALVVVAAFVAVAVVRPSMPAAPSRGGGSPAGATPSAPSASSGPSALSAPAATPPGVAAASSPSRPVPPASSLERAVLKEMNRLRADPRGYASELAGDREFFHGRLFEPPDRTPLETVEGVAALDEAIRDLESASPLPGFDASAGLALAARDHAIDLGSHGARGHVGSDGSTMRGRIERHGHFMGTSGEVISFGPDVAYDVVRELVIDDGVPDRGHRVNLLRPEFRVAGVACGHHRSMRFVCVVDFATTFEDSGR